MDASKYDWLSVETCNMCGTSRNEFKTLGKRLDKSQGLWPWNKKGLTTPIMRCKSCGLIFSNPQPTPKNLSDHYDVPPDAYWKEEYFVLEENYLKSMIDKLETMLDTNENPKVLDIGAGIGKGMKALSKRGFDVYGIEPSESFCQQAIKRIKIDPEKLLNVSIEKAEFQENYFDFILLNAVLEHLPDPSSALDKAVKWLKPGGVISIEVPSANWLISRMANLYYRAIGTKYVANLSPMHVPYHLYEFSLESFQKNGALHGYTVVDAAYPVCNTFMPKWLDFLLRPYMEKTNRGLEICVWLRKNICSAG